MDYQLKDWTEKKNPRGKNEKAEKYKTQKKIFRGEGPGKQKS